jgi:membrane protein DedA with SNARE-associated domain
VNPAHWPGGLAYLVVFVAAVVEGEVVFVAASTLVAAGQLNWLGVFLAGALGGSAGDQFYYYALRGRLEWLWRFPKMAERRDTIVERVQRNATAMILACRFLPGLRVAIPVACASAGISAPRFTFLNLCSAFGWAIAIMLVVAWGGPTALGWVGLTGWWGLAIPAVAVLLFARWLAHAAAEPHGATSTSVSSTSQAAPPRPARSSTSTHPPQLD